MVKKFLLNHRKAIGVLLVGLLISWLAYYLRLQQFSHFPPIGDTRDEFKYAFNGISLFKRGVPESWSWWDDYGEFPVRDIRGSDYRLVKPYFDEPPFFSLLSGAYSIWKGMDAYEKVDAGAMRWPMLKIGAVNVFLIFLLIYLVSGFFEALLASLIYATWPTVVLISRLSLAENFLVFLSLVSFLFLYWFLKRGPKPALILSSLIAGSAFLVKQTGIWIPATIIFLLISQKRKKEAMIAGAFAVSFFILWFAYGAYYDWSLFLRLQSKFSGREILLPDMIIHLFDTFRIAEKTMAADGWQIFAWVSVAAFAFLKKIRSQSLARLIPMVAVASHLVFFAVMSGHSKGWYRIPFYPFLAWTMAAVFLYFLERPHLLYAFFFTTLGVFTSWITGTGEAFLGQSQVRLYQFLFPLAMAPFLFYNLTEKPIWKKLSRFVLVGIFLFAIYFNIRTILFFQDQFWY